MLTKSDLANILDKKLDQKLAPIHRDIITIKKDVKSLRKDINGVLSMADRGLLNTQTRLKAVEKKLDFPDLDFA